VNVVIFCTDGTRRNLHYGRRDGTAVRQRRGVATADRVGDWPAAAELFAGRLVVFPVVIIRQRRLQRLAEPGVIGAGMVEQLYRCSAGLLQS